jgi:murein DD-endopeptidase MepM/ murein hydrolase activator NlpD
MRARAGLLSVVVALSVTVAMGLSGVASADITLPPLPPVPTVAVPPLPTGAPPLPGGPAPPAPVPAPPAMGGGGGSAGGSGSGSGASNGGGGAAGPPSTASDLAASSGAQPSAKQARRAKRSAAKAARDPVNPIIAGRPGASEVVDDEATPALRRATQDFLRADRRIAELAKLRDQIAAARTGAGRAAATYRALQTQISDLRAQAEERRQRSDMLRRVMLSNVRRSYQTGRPATSDENVRSLASAVARAGDAASRTEMLIGAATVRQSEARAEFDRFAAQYNQAKNQLTSINQRLQALAAQRTAALTAARQATSGDQARHQQTLAESGALGAQIRAASAQLAAAGHTVQGTGDFVQPSSGGVTSAYGQRMHPILHYVKLHTGTDFAVGDGFAHAADDGRVLFTVLSRAYGMFTVIDHGVLAGRHITTAYAHQAQFLVKPGDAVQKGQRIGVIGATGYATGPHLHFEVRDNGAVENPMTWLTN